MAQDVFSKMAEEQWILNEDGYLNVDTNVKEIVYHPYLNVILICTQTGVVRVLDVNTGVILHSSTLSAQNLSDVKCKYIPALDRVLFTDGQALGVRSDYNGVLLLDSVLQKNISDGKEEIKIELPLSEAIILKESLSTNSIPGVDHILNELTEVISNAQKHHKKSIKAQKWNTVCLNVPLEDLKYVTSTTVSNLIAKNQHTPELGVSSAVHERLSDLLGEKVNPSDRKSMASEWRRRETYSKWPHMDYKWALPDPMAQAGFYHHPNAVGDDRAMCFTCPVCLVSWERTDEPCSEHERHSPNCPFVIGEYTQNVPLSVTYATCPAVDATHNGVNIKVLGRSSVNHLIPAANADGLVSIFDVSGKVKRAYSFYVTQLDSIILDKYTQDFGQGGGWPGSDFKKYPVDKKVTAVCVVGDKSIQTDKSNPSRSTVICGLTLLSPNDNQPQVKQIDNTDYKLYLVIYDFTYKNRVEELDLILLKREQSPTFVPIEEPAVNFTEFLNNIDPMLSYYKSLIPGESDEFFIPPTTPAKNNAATKVLIFDDFNAINKTESSSSSHPVTNGPLSGAASELSISDHIVEVKNNTSSKKVNYARAVQCISLPEVCRNCQFLEISDIIPTHDQMHILVVIKSAISPQSFLALYPLDTSGEMVKLKDEAVLVRELSSNERPIEINLLPTIDKFGVLSEVSCDAEGNAVMVCVDGIVRIVNLSCLKIICYAKLENDKFASAAYCNSLDRLCVSTYEGSLHFYALNNAESESSDDHDEDDVFGMHVDSTTSTDIQDVEYLKYFQKPPDIIPLHDLKNLIQVCDFEPLKMGYCVVVPPCWGEFLQSLRQRRQPQGEGEQNSKTWRLLTDTTTWDEHIFEITLPNSTVLGHVDVHFTLQPCSTSPNIEVTLLRQCKNGIGHKKDVRFAVDDSITIDMFQWVDNPVISQEYLRAHNADILAGPIDLASSLDLTEQSGIVTLTSPKLYKTKVRNLLLHIRAVGTKDENKTKKFVDKSSSISIDKLPFTTRKVDFYMGCDVLHEISISLHTIKHVDSIKQGNLMLESTVFVDSLLLTGTSSNSTEEIGLVLDILDWIAAIRLTRNRSNNGSAPNQQFEFISLIQEHLTSLLQKCLLYGGRNIAHKVVRLVLTCCRGAENISQSCGEQFNSAVLKSLFHILDSITQIKSAAGLQWMFSLLLKVTTKSQEHLIASKCTSLLSAVTNELLSRSNPYHLILRGRYGLYGTPMEPELFDVEPPPYVKGDSYNLLTSNNTNQAAQEPPSPSISNATNYSFNKENISPKDVLSTSTTKLKYKNIASFREIRGLIETQPLHFSCIWSSEGTRLERADSNINTASFINNLSMFETSTPKPGEEQQVPFEETKVVEEVKVNPGYNKWVIEMMQESRYLDDKTLPYKVYVAPNAYTTPKLVLQNNPVAVPDESTKIPNNVTEEIKYSGSQVSMLPWQELLTVPPKQVIVVERMNSGARRHITLDFGKPILLTDVFIPSCSDLITLYIDIWLNGEDVDETRLVLAMDIGTRNLLLTDLQPPPLCRFMKITVVGRYGMSPVRCRIPLGYFYGHITMPPEKTNIQTSSSATDTDRQLGILSKLFEDISCRYSLACSKLKELLQPFIASDIKNATHLATYMNILKDRNSNISNVEFNKIFGAYQETIRYQYQLNIIRNVMSRIEGNISTTNQSNSEISTDKLTSIAEGLLEILLSLDSISEMSKEDCEQFFKGLCMTQSSRLQLLAAIFLEKNCGKSTFWGDFLADTLAENFATSCILRFPQDRLFILLSYLSRKSTEKSAIIDSALRVVHNTLSPLSTNQRSLLAANIDLPLLSWQLMYLSLQLSLCKTSTSSVNRWNWVLGEMVGAKNLDSSKGNSKKKAWRRINQSAGNKIPSYSSIVINPDKLKSMMINANVTRLSYITKFQEEGKLLNKEKKEQLPEKQNVLLKTPQFIDNNHCLIVAKELLQLILSMDHSSSADMLLLCFKVISKLVTLAKLQLGQVLKEKQLLDLIHFCISCKIPWAPFALGCFLQDAMELTSAKGEEVEMETETPNWVQTDSGPECDNQMESYTIDSLVGETSNSAMQNSVIQNLEIAVVDSILSKKNNPPMLNNNNFPPLPSVYESEDSDVEEILDDFQKLRTTSAKIPKQGPVSNSGLSCAMDLRLELGVQANSEITIKKMIIRNTQLLLYNISLESSQKETINELNPWLNPIENLATESFLNNQKMLTYCFQSLFENIQNHDPAKIEQILQLLLTLNVSNRYEQFAPGTIPKIILNCSSINYLISAMAWTPGLSLTTWCSALQTLTLVCNMNNGKKWFDLSGMANTIVNHPNFVQFFLNLLSGTGPVFNGKILAGPLLCKALHDFLVRLQMRCDVVSPTSKLGNHLKSTLLKVTYQLTQPSGSVACRLGPLDAQCKLLQTMLYLDFTNSDLSIAMSTLESTAALVHSYVINTERVKCISLGEKQGMMTSTFSDIFASVLGSDSNKQDRPVSYEDLLILMLKLLGRLVQTPLPNQQEAMDTETAGTSQTDECKAEQIHQENARVQPVVPCFADVVLQHHPTVIRLCRCLAACKSSSLCMLANVSQKVAFSTLSEPNTVGDAIFHLLALLARKASNKDLLLKPLLMFLSQAPQLSEPLLWFILQVLDTEAAIYKFFDAGGITILGNSIVNSTLSPSTLSKVGSISTVMQHFSGFNTPPESKSTTSTTGSSKKIIQPSLESKMSLINFAPYCTISCESSTAQSADVLIQGVSGSTHRRARAPLWSYHFYPEENHTELMLQLPSAILLREVQLQPHSGSLSTSPSYVALEVSANGPSRLSPVCLPLPTSGLTNIIMHLPAPKVVNCVLIRLYKPRDATTIGLLQIRLLGSYAFGGITQGTDVEDESHCKHSLGWLRLLHHCFTLASDPDIKRQIVSCASSVSNLLTTCCGLLLVPSHILPVYLPCLEKVLRELALHSSENGFHAFKVLLDSKSGIEPLMITDVNWQDRLINISGYQSACELLYQICEHQDSHTCYRVQILLDWLKTTTNEAVLTGNTQNCNAAYFSSISSILWTAKQTNVQYDLKSLITVDLFNSIYSLKTQTETNISLKYSLDSLLCSICYIIPEFYPLLLEKIGVLVPNLSTGHEASISDDRKDTEGLTDDNKRVYEVTSGWYGHLVIGDLSSLMLTREQLETIALVSRSPTSIQQLLDSGLPKLLNGAIFEFCQSENTTVPMAKLENVTNILQFLTDVSDEKMMRDWLGSEDGSSFWLPLLKWLCKKPITKISNLQTEAHVHLEEVCVKFLSKCCLCHAANQTRLARVLCSVIYLQSNGISGFMRRLILQLLLENEKIPVSIEADETLYKSAKLIQNYIPAHPAFKQTYNRAMLCLSTNTTLLEILEQHIFFKMSYKSELSLNKKTTLNTKKDIFKSWFAAEEQEMSMAAGVTAKDKRAKDSKNQLSATPLSKKKRYTVSSSNCTENVEGRIIKCESFSDQPLPLTVNLGQLLRLIESKGTTTDWPYVHLKIYQCKNNDDKCNTETNSSVLQQPPICSALQVFSSMGGLALLAQHLPTVYPEAIRSAILEKAPPDTSDSEWIKVDESDEAYEDFLEDVTGTNSPTKSSILIPHVPPHSLTAFGLFLRLPGYAEVLLKDMKKALYLLRLTLGVTDDGEGGDIFNSPISDSLPTLPFEVLKKLYDGTPLTTDDGRLLRRISINIGVVPLLLGCIGIFSHQFNGNGSDKDAQNSKNKEDKSQLYWAKGTGFGTGSTQQSWNVEQALLKQKSEEEHVTVLLQVLASYINPNDSAEDELIDNVLPHGFHDLLTQSALLPAICSYLRNDSVLDMARHIPLYKAVLQLLRAIAMSTQVVDLLLPQKNRGGEPSVSSLLKNMKTCVDTYASKLRFNTKTKTKSKLGEQLEELEQGEGLATLMPDIHNTANLVERVTSGLVESDSSYDSENSIDKKVVVSLEEQYLKIMKNLQFSSYEMITELPEGGIKFVVSHHFENNVKTTSEQSHPTRVKRIAQEAVTLSTSLPLSYSSSVFVRYDNSRLDVMKVLITGPADTPYANGCFEFDVFFPPDYPQSPMMINLETTGHHSVRFNPNLYNDGKVCLSVLNTWHGRPEEKWNAQTSSFLQVLVSIQSLILVPEPYFNEPGYERTRGTPAGTVSSKDYNLNICQSTVRFAMLEQILNPCPCFKEIIHTHFYIKRFEILAQVEKWINEVEVEISKEKKMSRTNKKSPTITLESFKKIYQRLREALLKLRPPPELEEDLSTTPTNNMEVTNDLDKDMVKMVNDMCE